MLQTLLTVVGTLFSAVGLGCAFEAYRRTWRDHADELLAPQLNRRIQFVRARVRRLFGRPKIQVVEVSGIATAWGAGSARVVVSGPAITDDATPDEQISLLIRRVETIERQAANDRDHWAAELEAVRKMSDKIAQESAKTAAAVQEKAKAMVLDSVRLQLWGLGFVGLGTAFLAAAGFTG